MKFYVYILFSFSKDSFYVGQTGDDQEEPVRKLNTGQCGFTDHHDDWLLMYHESFTSKDEALKRKNQIINWESKIHIEKLIGLVNPGYWSGRSAKRLCPPNKKNPLFKVDFLFIIYHHLADDNMVTDQTGYLNATINSGLNPSSGFLE